MAHRALSKEQIMGELEEVAAKYTSFLCEYGPPPITRYIGVEPMESLLGLEEQIMALHEPICKLSNSSDRVEANRQAVVLLNAIDSVLCSS